MKREARIIGWRRPALGALLCACASLAGCPIGGGDAPLGAAQAQAPASAFDPGQILAELETIDRVGRAKPEEYARQLQAMLERTTPGSAARAEVLVLRAIVLAFGRSREGLDTLEAAIPAWPNTRTLPDLRVGLATAKGRFNYAQGDMREAVRAVGDVDDALFARATPRQQLRLLDMRAQAYSEVGQFDAAVRAAQAELTLAASIGSTWRRATALIDLSLCYFRSDQLAQARKTHDEAMELARKDPDPVLMYTVYNVRGVLYGDDDNGQIAQDSFTEALRYAEQAGDDSQRALVMGNLADMMLHRKQYAEALKMAEQVLPLARKTRRLVAEIGARHNAGLAKIALGRVAEGREDVRVAITMDEQNGSTTYAAQDWEELGRYLERAGDYAGAIDAYHEHRRVVDRLLRNDTRKAVVEAQEHFEAERRAAEIELLNRDNSLKEERIRARNLELGLWASLAGCAVLAAALLVLAYQRIRKTNTALAATNDLLKMQSEIDPLTGLANRRYFQAAIKALASEDNGGRLSGAVFLIDIDHFKRINDQFGHAVGDTVLIEVARRLRAALREDDLVVRWGGEEFLIVVKGDVDEGTEPARDDGNIARPFVDSRALNPDSAQTLARRLLDLIGGEPVRHEDLSVPVTASIGFASFPLEPHQVALPWERAIDLVDTVMYIAKAHGRNKAYGIAHIEAADEEQVAAMASRMESAWQAGRVQLVSLSGPTPAATPVPPGEVAA